MLEHVLWSGATVIVHCIIDKNSRLTLEHYRVLYDGLGKCRVRTYIIHISYIIKR